MNAVAVVGCTLAGGLSGFVAGFWVGCREGGDLNIAPAIYAPFGGLIGGLVGVIIGAGIFA